LKFDIYTTRSLKVCLGIRETGTTAENGANGGTTGTIEWVGATNVVSSCPQPTRTIAVSNWTTVEFDLPADPKQSFTGDGILSPGQQALEHLALVGTSAGAYTVYLDNFQVVTTTALPGTVTMKANSSLTFTATATDPDPGAGLGFGLDADFVEAHPTAVLDGTTGVFTWTPAAGDIGTTNAMTVTAEDSPTNGGIEKSDSKAATIIVTSDTLAPQSVDGGAFVAGEDTVRLEWDSIPGATYAIQAQSTKGGGWVTLYTVTAVEAASAVEVTNAQGDRHYRVVAVSNTSAE